MAAVERLLRQHQARRPGRRGVPAVHADGRAVHHRVRRVCRVETTRKRYAADPDAPIKVCHAIYPRSTYALNARLAKNMPVAPCHFELDSKHLLREGGYHEMPVIVPRWAVIPDTSYAIGPMFDALPTRAELNEFLRMDRMNAELAIAGMWIAEDDGVLNPSTIKVGPRKIVVANSVDSMKQPAPAATGNWPTRALHAVSQGHPQDSDGRPAAAAGRPAMTATEVHVRVGLIRQLFGPIYGRLQASTWRRWSSAVSD